MFTAQFINNNDNTNPANNFSLWAGPARTPGSASLFLLDYPRWIR